MLRQTKLAPLLLAAGLGGCATGPTGPTLLALPGTGMGFEQFQQDDGLCRQYAYAQIGGVPPNQAAANNGLATAAIATALGAAVGAAFGGGQGAAIGAGTGLLMGSAMGTGMASAAAGSVQQRYDNAYVQCMYAKGHRVPVQGVITSSPRPAGQAPSANIPPPPPGTPPPPPTR